MGLRGPAPTPSNILALRGSWRARENPSEPSPEPGIPDPPDWLDGDAVAAWNELAPQIDAMGVLALVDRHMLALYCRTWSRWRTTDDFLRKHGDCHIVKDRTGTVTGVRMYPQVKAADRLVEQLVRLGAMFGISPSSRTRLHTLSRPAPKPSSLDRFFTPPDVTPQAPPGA